MKLLAVSNLYPRPDVPRMGMFNAQLFREFQALPDVQSLTTVCLVPGWKLWGRRGVRFWRSPEGAFPRATYDPVAYVPVVGRDWNAALYARSARSLRALSAEADVIYASWLYPDAVAAVQLAVEQKKTAWMMVLGSDVAHLDYPRRRKQILAAVERSAGVICVAPHLAERVIAAGADAAKVHVVPNGVDHAQFHYQSRCEARQALADAGVELWRMAEEETPVVLFVGNLVDVKAPHVMMDAFCRLSQSYAKAGAAGMERPMLVVVGDGPLRPALEARAKAAGLADRVHFVGSRPHAEIAGWLNACDSLCLTSRSEGMPNVILEALACGLPVVATDVGACADMLHGVPHSLVVPSGDPYAVAQALGSVLAAQPDREALAGGRRGYGWHDQARQIMDLMQAGEVGR